MKKFLTVAALIATIALTACGNGTPNETDTSASNENTNPPVNSEVVKNKNKCSGYESGSVSTAYENQCYLP